MPRVGENPMMWTPDFVTPEKVTVTILVYVPQLGGYWEHSLDVLKACLGSVRPTTEIPFDLMVYDNGSCEPVREYLLEQHHQGTIQFLVLSQDNIGKVGAWNVMFLSAPGETVAYADSDTLFLPGWLEASLEVLHAFPEAGLVTAQPARGLRQFSATLSAAEQDPTVLIETGDFIPDHYRHAHRCGLGDTEEQYDRRCGDKLDTRLSRNGVSAYVTASHFQFVTTKDAIQTVLPLETTRPLGDAISFDEQLNKAGFWRLSTIDYLVHHMGNRIPLVDNAYDRHEWLDHDALPLSLLAVNTSRAEQRRGRSSLIGYLLRRSRVKRALRSLNILTYRLLAQR